MTRPTDLSLDHTLPFATDASLRRRFLISNEPAPANLRVGMLLEVIDKLAEDLALGFVRRTEPDAWVVTAAIDNIVLHRPADVTRDLALHARLNWVGRSSMEIGIRIEHPGETRVHVASSYFTMAARTGNRDTSRSVAVAPLTYADDVECRRRDKAIWRRENYRQRLATAGEPPTVAEHAMLARLHAAQDEPGFDGLLASQLSTTTWERMYPDQENVPMKIFGGFLIRRAFELATIQAEAVASDRPVVVRVNRINFLQPVRIGDTLRFTSRVVYTGRTSFCVEVDIERVERDRITRALSNTCVFTFVNVDATLAPQPVPRVYPTTYAEDSRYLAAHRRRERFAARRSGRDRLL